GGSSNYWQLNNQQISPVNALWHDLMIGGTATSSAKFYAQANTGNASMSGTLTIGNGQAIQSAYHDLVLNYKNGANSWTPAVTFTTYGTAKFASDVQLLSDDLLDSDGTTLVTLDASNNHVLFPGAGNVGIGLATPTAKLDVAGDASVSGMLTFRGTTDPKINILNGESFGIRTSRGGDAGLSEKFTVLADGNVGINEASPLAKLTITETDATNALRINVNGATTAYSALSSSTLTMNRNDTSTVGFIIKTTNNGSWGTNGGYIALSPNNSETMRVTTAGNVGIGITNPAYTFDLTGKGHVAYTGTPNNDNALQVEYLNTNDTVETLHESAGVYISNEPTGTITSDTSASSRITNGLKIWVDDSTVLDAADLTGIATKNVKGIVIDAKDTGGAYATTGENIAVVYGGIFRAQGSNSNRSSTAYGLWIDSNGADNNFAIYANAGINYFNGNVGIGTTAPGYKLEASAGSGKGIHVVSTSSTALETLYCESSGTNGCGGNRAWYNSSDARLKHDVATITNPLEKIEALRGVTYKWNDSNESDMGFIAQEVLQVVPEVVGQDANGMYGLRTTQLIGLLVEGAKAQQVQIRELQLENASISPSLVEMQTSLDELAQTQDAFASITLSSTGDVQLERSIAGEYTLKSTITQSPITTILASAQQITANLTAGKIKTTELQSAKIETEELNTSVVRSNAPLTNTEIRLNPDSIDIVNTESAQNPITVATFDAEGNASFSGEITAESTRTKVLRAQKIESEEITSTQAQFGEATISGTLYADSITANTIAGLNDTVDQAVLKSVQEQIDTNGFISTSNTTALQELIASLLPADSASTEAALAELSMEPTTVPLSVESLTITGDLTTVNASVQHQLSVSNTVFISQNIISVQNTDTLYIEPYKNASIDILAGTLKLNSLGHIEINGDVSINGSLLADRIELRDSVTGTTAASIDASGSAVVQQLTTPVIAIATDEQPTINLDNSITSNTTVGQAVLPKLQQTLTIYSKYIKDTSLIYLTPTSSTQNQTMYVASKTTCAPDATIPCEPSFTISVDAPATSPIAFNWWIVDLQASETSGL
ncbi:MAG TPA: hypothetical protein DCW55_01935, partial [Candidatus Pacebacteria bacterium]|nr:hypothetical protein [Candidatus Paceibacterota bacterium]